MRPQDLLANVITCIKSTDRISGLEFFPISKSDRGEIFTAACKADLDGKKCVGMATSKSKDKAAFVSVMELIERMALMDSPKMMPGGASLRNLKNQKELTVEQIQQNHPLASNWLGTSSNGIAIHTSPECALDNALNELVERHTVLKALHCRKPPALLSAELITTSQGDISTKTFAWKGACERAVVVIRGEKEFRNFYAFGSRSTLKEAVIKAKEELELKLSVVTARFPDPLKFIFGNENSKFHWSQDTPETDRFFSEAVKTLPIVDAHVTDADIWYRQIPLPQFLSSCSELFVFKTVSPSLQQLFFGDWDVNRINAQAITAASLPSERHILG